MRSFDLTLGDQSLRILQDADGKFIIPDAVREFLQMGSALKPAWEPICVARRPLSEKTVAGNLLRWSTGAINIDGCRVETDDEIEPFGSPKRSSGGIMNGTTDPREKFTQAQQGRWPANIIHDGSEEVLAAFPQSGAAYVNPAAVAAKLAERKPTNKRGVTSFDDGKPCSSLYTDEGSAARFFYTAKADSDDRLGSKHPTVKPVDLMQWLVRLVTPKGGLVLDPFAGTGTTAEACYREGMRCMLIERETEYQADIRRRMALVMAGPDERSRESIKAKTKGQSLDHGPLFGLPS